MHVRRAALATIAILAATLTACSSDEPSQSKAERVTAAASSPASSAPDCGPDSDLSQADWVEQCGDSAPAAAGRHYDSAQDIADALNDAGLTASKPQEEKGESYITEVGGTAYDFTVTDQADQPAPYDAGINMFPNPEALAAWTPISKSFGGIAVTGDTWSVSLPTDDETARADSQQLAPKVAKALGGTVQQ